MKLRIKDKVIVITGKDRGKTGTITKIINKQDAVIVEGLNIKTKHIKKTADRPGQKITVEAPIKSSKLMIIDPKTGVPSRIGYKILNNGKKERISKVSGATLDNLNSAENASEKSSKKTRATKTTKKSE